MSKGLGNIASARTPQLSLHHRVIRNVEERLSVDH